MNIGMDDQGAARHGHSLARGTILAVALLGFATFEAPTWIPGSGTHAAQQTSNSPAKDAKKTPSKDAASAKSIPSQTPPEAPKQARQAESAPQAEAAPQDSPGEWHRLTATPAPATPPSNATAAPAQTAAIPSAAELRSQFNELSVRANTANSRLQSFQEQQSRQGLSLRADIREAQARMDLQMQESATALESGNVDAARQSMRYAQSAVETIEKFLGR